MLKNKSMSSSPEAFPDIDLASVGVHINGNSPEILGKGYISRAWRIGDLVVKVTRSSMPAQKANDTAEIMRQEHEALEDFVGSHMPDTEYHAARATGSDRFRAVTTQPFVEGESIDTFLKQPGSQTEGIQEFLQKCSAAYKRSKIMPDIAGAVDLFDVFQNKNVLVNPQSGEPVLVDTNLCLVQRIKALGPIWTRAVYLGTEHARRRLENNHV